MKKLLVVFLVILLVSCGSSKSAEVTPLAATLVPTIQPTAVLEPTVTTSEGFANSIISMNPQNYADQIQLAIEVANFFNPEIGSKLQKCEIGIATSEGYEVKVRNDSNMCLILFVPASLATTKERFRDLLISDGNPNFVIASTQTVGEDYYPFIFLADGKFDLYYLARVMVHEGFHMNNMANVQDCIETPTCEEANAYEVQFKMLEKMYSQDVLNLGYKHYALEGSNSFNLRALDMEQSLYEKWKEGNLESYLAEIGYGDY